MNQVISKINNAMNGKDDYFAKSSFSSDWVDGYEGSEHDKMYIGVWQEDKELDPIIVNLRIHVYPDGTLNFSALNGCNKKWGNQGLHRIVTRDAQTGKVSMSGLNIESIIDKVLATAKNWDDESLDISPETEEIPISVSVI